MWERKTYKQIILDHMDRAPDQKTMAALDETDRFVEHIRKKHPEKADKFLLRLQGAMNMCHFDEYTAWTVIWDMIPVGVTQGEFKNRLPKVDDFYNEVMEAYSLAKTEARERGFEAPELSGDYNKWDMFVTGAMYHADYWMLNPSHAASFVYMYLSDPDYPDHSKIWDYIVK